MERMGASKALSEVEKAEDWLILTPGVGLDSKGDGMGQQYRTPHEVILERGCDVIIVGRGIYGKGEGSPSDTIAKEALRYQMEGWAAYEETLSMGK
jgi:orotidine-5'-phosphate decarboxylase